MDFANERYVRLYTRNTTNWKRLGWAGQCVLMQLLRVVDRAGVLEIADMAPVDAVSLHTDMPVDVVRPGLDRALELGSVELRDGALVLPNYLDAQEAAQSDKQRQRESRERRRDIAKTKTPVTNRDEKSQAVTASHTPSQAVTPAFLPSEPAKPAEPSSYARDLEKPPVGEAPPGTPPSQPKRDPWLVAWLVLERTLGMGAELGHPEKHRSWLLQLAAAAKSDAGCDAGSKFENAVERIVRAWMADPWVEKNRPSISNIGVFLERPRKKPVVRVVPPIEENGADYEKRIIREAEAQRAAMAGGRP